MKSFNKKSLGALHENTRLVAAGRDPARFDGFVNTPVYHGSTVLFPTVQDMLERRQRYTYGRRGSPTAEALQDALQALEGGAGVVLCPSGLSAVSTALLSILSAGDHLLMTDTAYGPTRHLCDTELKRFGIETTYYDPAVGAGIDALIRPNTRAVYCESPGSLTFEMQDVPAIADAAHRHGALVLLDNTWASPLHCKPHALGVDLSIQAGTKYIVGHSDVMLGTISASDLAWPKLRHFYYETGLCVGPDDIYLALRGLRTLSVRMRQHEASALAIAAWLSDHPQVERVLHPGLPQDPGHAIWRRDFTGSSGLFSMILQPGPMTAVAAFLDHLRLFGLGYSWGGFESLAIPFDCAPQRTATRWEPGGPCVRLHIGLEDIEDLKADLDEGLARYAAAR